MGRKKKQSVRFRLFQEDAQPKYNHFCSVKGCVARCFPVTRYSNTGRKLGTYWKCENNHSERNKIRKSIDNKK